MLLEVSSFKVVLDLESTAVPTQSYFKKVRILGFFFVLFFSSWHSYLSPRLSKLGVKNVGGLRLDCPHTFEICNLYVVTAVTLPGKEGKKKQA